MADEPRYWEESESSKKTIANLEAALQAARTEVVLWRQKFEELVAKQAREPQSQQEQLVWKQEVDRKVSDGPAMPPENQQLKEVSDEPAMPPENQQLKEAIDEQAMPRENQQLKEAKPKRQPRAKKAMEDCFFTTCGNRTVSRVYKKELVELAKSLKWRGRHGKYIRYLDPICRACRDKLCKKAKKIREHESESDCEMTSFSESD